MNTFEEFNFGDKYVLRFYRVDNGLVCDINESMVPELHEVVKQINRQADRIGVLEANHKIQKDINDAALQYIEQLEQGLRASINLNRAQNERK
jgi:hypothetical protein